MPKKGDVVLYVDEFDADKSYSPNVSPAVIAKLYDDNSADLFVMFSEGHFSKMRVPMGDANTRMSWYPKC